MFNKLIHLLWLLPLSACIQTELIPEILEPTLTLGQQSLALQVGDAATLSATYTDEALADMSHLITWRSTEPQVMSVDNDGLALALSPGQAWAVAEAPGGLRDSLLVTVVADAAAVAGVTIDAPPATLTVGETAALTATARNSQGEVVGGQTIVWQSSNPQVLAIDPSTGLATALSAGEASVTATAGAISSLPAPIQVIPAAGLERSGMFSGNSGYTVKGTATLRQNGNTLSLELGTNFMTSNGPGLAVYLAKNASGGLNSQNSLKLGDLQTNMGMQTYAIPQGTGLNDFDYVVIYCVPFNVRFGTAMLNN